MRLASVSKLDLPTIIQKMARNLNPGSIFQLNDNFVILSTKDSKIEELTSHWKY